jgi:AGZA family xanthine/uracil permease-like MFS transporter
MLAKACPSPRQFIPAIRFDPFSYSIADGLALGFISYAVVNAFSGCAREISWLTYLLAIVLMAYSSLCEAE